jgi:hypothetical protein
MTKIDLRSYNREIDTLIERGQTEEAAAHCKYILKFYSKHLTTYSLLAKAYLESQHYAEATDILKRILSVTPDDFIAHLGMSIIREDEHAPEKAIYHMERAFEIQPSNSMIQDELRRLYRIVYKSEPSRIRLTRGALVRMYMRGELYNQAIAEAKAAIAEDPKRIDLEVLLARIYYQANMMSEAEALARQILKKLPLCFEANKIVAKITAAHKKEESQQFQEIVNSLDPYMSFVTDDNTTSADIPDSMVLVEHLDDWQSLKQDQPGWATNLGVTLEKPNESLPEWMVPSASAAETQIIQAEPTRRKMPEHPAAPQSAPAAPEPLAEAQPEESIPEWMREAGWSASTQPEQTPAPVDYESPEPASTGEAEAGELPDWLQQMQPPEELEPVSTPQSDALLDQILPPATVISEPLAPQEEALPDWLMASTESQATESQVEAVEALPDWLQESSPEAVSAEAPQNEPEMALPDWLSSSSMEEEIQTSDAIPPTVIVQPAAPSSSEAVAAAPVGDDMESALAWLDSLAARQGADEATLLTKPDERLETPPDWIKQEMAENPASPITDNLPDWLQEVQPAEATVQPEEELATEQLPDWLQEAQPTVAAALPEEELASEPLPDWLQEAQPAVAAAQPEEELATEQLPDWLQEAQPAVAAAQPEEELATEQLPDWLQQAQPAEAAAQPEEELATEQLPDWLQEAQPAVAAAQPEEELATEQLPDWLQEVQPAEAAAQPEEELATEQLPDWLQEVQPAEAAAQPEEELATEQLPDWLQEAQPAEPSAAKAVEQLADEELPEWLTELEPQSQSVEVPQAADTLPTQQVNVEPENMDMDASFAWLEALAARQGAQEGLLTTEEERQAAVNAQPIAQTEASESLPDWLQESKEPSAQEPAAELTNQLPDWLQEIEPANPPEAAAEPETASTLPEWLQETGQPLASASTTQPVTPVESVEALPDWLQQVEAENEAPPAFTEPETAVWQTEQSMPVAETSSSTQPEDMDMDASFAWLEALAARQGAQEGLLTTEEERQAAVSQTESIEALPDWLQETEQPSQSEAVEAATEPIEALPDWLQETEQPVPPEAVEAAAEPVEALPDWLQETEHPVQPEAVEAVAEPVEALPDWLQETEQPVQPEAVEAAAQPVEVLPDWLQETEQPSQTETLISTMEPFETSIEGHTEEIPLEAVAETIEVLEPETNEPLPVTSIPEWLEGIDQEEAAGEEIGFEEKTIGTLSTSEITAEEPAVNQVEPVILQQAEEPPVAPEIVAPETKSTEENVGSLEQAKSDLNSGKLEQALQTYNSLIQSGQSLEETIHDLREALYRHPVNVEIWQTLGDAYFHSNRIQEALDAYTKAEEVLR